MPLKVLIIPDKFKGTLTAHDAADAIARGWRKARPGDSLELLPMSDGGDGFGDVISQLRGARIQQVKTIDAAHRPCRTSWWWEPKSKTAIIESARVIGLSMLPPKKFHPFALDTFGLGALIQAASARGARRCVMGIGGSATNDGGFGLARSLGWKFLDRKGAHIDCWTRLHQLARIEPPERVRWFKEMIVAVDVQNPLLGVAGATRVYGPQKGLAPGDLGIAEKNLRRLAYVMALPTQTGAGAAGGLGFGLLAFLGARLEPGFDVFAHDAKLEERLRSADLVITGEGQMDRSTLMGKGVGEIAKSCRSLKIPCVALAGRVTDKQRLARTFSHVAALTELTTVSRALREPARWLERLAEYTS